MEPRRTTAWDCWPKKSAARRTRVVVARSRKATAAGRFHRTCLQVREQRKAAARGKAEDGASLPRPVTEATRFPPFVMQTVHNLTRILQGGLERAFGLAAGNIEAGRYCIAIGCSLKKSDRTSERAYRPPHDFARLPETLAADQYCSRRTMQTWHRPDDDEVLAQGTIGRRTAWDCGHRIRPAKSRKGGLSSPPKLRPFSLALIRRQQCSNPELRWRPLPGSWMGALQEARNYSVNWFSIGHLAPVHYSA
jgi:hypothetical protein